MTKIYMTKDYETGEPKIENAPFEGGGWHWVAVSTQLVEQMENWTRPIRARVAGERHGILVLEFKDEQ